MARFLAAPLLDGRLGGTLALARAELAAAMGHLDHARTARRGRAAPRRDDR